MKRKFELGTKHRFQKENFRQELDNLVSDTRHKGIPTEAYIYPSPTAKLFTIAPATNADYDFVMVYSSIFKDPLSQVIPKYLVGKNQYPALGNFAHTIKQHDGRKLAPKDEKFVTTPKELKRDILNLAQRGQKTGRNYLERFRVFALTGKPILEATNDALKKTKAAR